MTGKTILGMSAALAFCLTAGARTVSVPTYVCNPGAAVTVPVTLDEAGGLACASVKLTYDAQVLVPVKVVPGSLGAAFAEDPVIDFSESGAVFVGLFAAGGAAAGGGTLALVTFRAREGTAGLYSDVTVADVTLGTVDGLRADAGANGTKVVSGMIRVVAADAQVARLERAQTVCANTSVGSLELTAGDGIAAADDLGPVSVAGETVAPGSIPVAAPASGWGGATYRLLTTRTAGLVFALQGLDADDSQVFGTVAEGDGRVTYTVRVSVGGEIAVTAEEAGGGSAEVGTATANKVRALYAGERGRDAALAQAVDAWKEREKKAVGVRLKAGSGLKASELATCVDLGIAGAPSFDAELGIVEFTYEPPTLEVIAFNPLGDGTATARIRVTPGRGNRIAQQVQTGYLHLYGTSDLSQKMTKKGGVEFDLAPYTRSETLGEAEMTISLGDSAFFRVRAGSGEDDALQGK